MKFLLDVNALLALGLLEHEFHSRVGLWVATVTSDPECEFLTCPITELGFVRVLSQAPQYGLTVSHARALLAQMRTQDDVRFRFIPDDHDVSRLPFWVKAPRQTTDGHLAELARTNGALLATLDERIPGGFLIPDDGSG